jgi:hypothetical protein
MREGSNLPYCPNCGKEVPSEASFCPDCGRELLREKRSGLSIRKNYFSKPFVYCIMLSVILIFSIVIIGGSRGEQATTEQATQTQKDIEGQAGNATALSIFLNNAQIALISFIPIVGSAWMLFIQYSTGYTMGNLAKAYNMDFILVISYSIATFDGLLEYSAYILALSESFMIVYSALEKNVKERLLKHTWKTLLIVVGLLLVGGIVEATTLGSPIV